MNELEQIVTRTRTELVRRKQDSPHEQVQLAASERLQSDPPRPFVQALREPGLSVIAEHKRRSPSAGPIRSDVQLEDVVSAYERGGARALSVLTESDGFGGSLDDLRRARAASTLPILRKDFIVDTYQVDEAVAAGADAILLIVAALDPDALGGLYRLAIGWGLGVLVEVHDASELETAQTRLAPEVIGINNRDLDAQKVDIQTTFELMPDVPAGKTVVAESGISGRDELAELERVGVDAVLIGGALMLAEDPEAKTRELTGADETRENLH